MKLPLYRVRRWDEIYENNRSRELKDLDWVPMPNNHDGDGYSYMMSQRRCVSYFAAWNWIVQVASKCDPRGTLIRKTGKPHTAETIARQCRAPSGVFEPALKFFAADEILWLEVVEFIEDNEISQEGAGISQEGALKGREGKGKKGREEKCRIVGKVIEHLNRKTGSRYRPDSKESLSKIGARLDDGFTYEDCIKVIDNMVAAWKGDAKMEPYLRPETLFRVSKFEGYLNRQTSGNERADRLKRKEKELGNKDES